jgi:hypothetical protein
MLGFSGRPILIDWRAVQHVAEFENALNSDTIHRIIAAMSPGEGNG